MPSLDDIEFWKERVRWGLRWQSTLQRTRTWSQARKWYHNEYGPGVVSVNLTFAIGRKLVIDLYFKNPIILVKALHPDAAKNAPIMESVDRALVASTNHKRELKLVILDAFLTNLGVMKFGYHSWSTLTPASKGATKTTAAMAMTGLDSMLSEMFGEPEPPAPTADLTDAKYPLSNYHESIKPDSPWGIYWPTEDVVFPWGCKRIEEAPWVAFRFTRPKFDMLHDPAYENVKDYKGTYTTKYESEGLVSPKDFERSNTWPEEMVIGYEIWDRQTRRVRVVALDCPKYFRNEDPRLGVESFVPAEFLQFNPTNDSCYGVSDVEQIYKQVLEYNETRTIEMIHKKMALTRMGVDKNKITKEDIEKILAGNIMTAIPVNGDPSNAISFYTPPMNSDVFRVGDEIRRDIGELMNFSRNQGGAAESPRKSASEAMIIQQAIVQRADERRDQVGDFIERAFATKFNPICWQNWTTQRYAQVAGQVGWQSYIGANLKGYYGVETAADSGIPLSKEQRKADTRELFGVLRGDPAVDQFALYDSLVRVHDGLDPSELMPGGREGFEQRMTMAAEAAPPPGEGEEDEGGEKSQSNNPGRAPAGGKASSQKGGGK